MKTELVGLVFSAVKELLEFSDITVTLYAQLHSVNIAYVIIHRTASSGWQFASGIACWQYRRRGCDSNIFFRTYHQDLRETSDLTVEDAGVYHFNMVCGVVVGLQ